MNHSRVDDSNSAMDPMIRRKAQQLALGLYEKSGAALMMAHLLPQLGPDAVFIWIPKTTGTSCYHSLGSPPLLNRLKKVRLRFANKGMVTFGHLDYAQLVEAGHVSSRFDRSAYKFGFTRNPFDRTVSLYCYLQKVDRIPRGQTFLGFCRGLQENGCKPIGLYESLGLSQCNPQTRWVEMLQIDFLGKYENLSKDLGTVLQRLSLDSSGQPHLNSTSHRHYTDYYCPESVQIVQDFFAEDFRCFRYETSLPTNKSAAA